MSFNEVSRGLYINLTLITAHQPSPSIYFRSHAKSFQPAYQLVTRFFLTFSTLTDKDRIVWRRLSLVIVEYLPITAQIQAN